MRLPVAFYVLSGDSVGHSYVGVLSRSAARLVFVTQGLQHAMGACSCVCVLGRCVASVLCVYARSGVCYT